MTTSNPNPRVRNTTIIKPILYGNKARYFGQTRDDGFTHEWTVYVKPYFDEDVSKYIKKVHFKLHESYQNSVRVINEPPFQVNEAGWGEFDIHIRIYFTETTEKAVSFVHHLTLFPPGQQRIFTSGLHKYEFYDELIFSDPPLTFHKILVDLPSNVVKAREKKYEEKRETYMNTLSNARQSVLKEIEELSIKFENAKEQITKNRSIISTYNKNHMELCKSESKSNTDGLVIQPKS
ncbi:hypothetical protein A3Q56_03826 [Intoshia linei]|uniref:YEATS domain-containing protein n=1 Tax=Intoshia linei TaxID=1819745 RepID=A0A177B474_9BILA|nr:hypothetical protein A3Q56_03826 [Intoshia linei]